MKYMTNYIYMEKTPLKLYLAIKFGSSLGSSCSEFSLHYEMIALFIIITASNDLQNYLMNLIHIHLTALQHGFLALKKYILNCTSLPQQTNTHTSKFSPKV